MTERTEQRSQRRRIRADTGGGRLRRGRIRRAPRVCASTLCFVQKCFVPIPPPPAPWGGGWKGGLRPLERNYVRRRACGQLDASAVRPALGALGVPCARTPRRRRRLGRDVRALGRAARRGVRPQARRRHEGRGLDATSKVTGRNEKPEARLLERPTDRDHVAAAAHASGEAITPSLVQWCFPKDQGARWARAERSTSRTNPGVEHRRNLSCRSQGRSLRGQAPLPMGCS